MNTLIMLLISAIIGGVIGQLLAGFSFGGFLVALIVGIVGAFLGYGVDYLFNLPLEYNITVSGQEFAVIWPIIGAAIFAIFLSFLTRRSYM